jgi:hypothetical protein
MKGNEMDYSTNAVGIRHGKDNPLTLIRDEYLFITEEDTCASAVLAALEHWSNWKVGRKEEATPWITRSHAKLAIDMLGLYGVRKIADAIKKLESLGFLEVKGTVGETPRYRLNVENINAALEGYIPYGERTSAKVQTSPAEGKRYPGRKEDPLRKKEEGVRKTADIIDTRIDSLIDLPIETENRTSSTLYTLDKGNHIGEVNSSENLKDFLASLRTWRSDFQAWRYTTSERGAQDVLAEIREVYSRVMYANMNETLTLDMIPGIVEELSQYGFTWNLQENPYPLAGIHLSNLGMVVEG